MRARPPRAARRVASNLDAPSSDATFAFALDEIVEFARRSRFSAFLASAAASAQPCDHHEYHHEYHHASSAKRALRGRARRRRPRCARRLERSSRVFRRYDDALRPASRSGRGTRAWSCPRRRSAPATRCRTRSGTFRGPSRRRRLSTPSRVYGRAPRVSLGFSNSHGALCTHVLHARRRVSYEATGSRRFRSPFLDVDASWIASIATSRERQASSSKPSGAAAGGSQSRW